MKVRACWTVFYIVYILCLGRDEGADSWTVVYIVHILNLSPNEGAGAMDCVLYRILLGAHEL